MFFRSLTYLSVPALFLSFLTACGDGGPTPVLPTPPNPDGGAVQDVIGGVLLGGQAEANALARLQQETARLGGNAVFFSSVGTGIAGSQVLGEAYRCADGTTN